MRMLTQAWKLDGRPRQFQNAGRNAGRQQVCVAIGLIPPMFLAKHASKLKLSLVVTTL